MAFTNPVALLLLVSLPYFMWLGWPHARYRRRRDIISLFLRLVIAICLILGLAGARVLRPADQLAVVFLLDESDSISAQAHDQAETYIRTAISQLNPSDRAGL